MTYAYSNMIWVPTIQYYSREVAKTLNFYLPSLITPSIHFISKLVSFRLDTIDFEDKELLVFFIRRHASISMAMIKPRATRGKMTRAYASKPPSWIVRLSLGSVDITWEILDIRPISKNNNTLSNHMVRQR